jgi:predicted RND superfamily exporter protein
LEPSTFGPRVWYEPLINAVVDHRRIAVLFVILASAVFASFVPRLEADVTLKSGINTDTDQYRRYQEFLKVFGNEEFLLIAIKKAPSIDVARMLAAVEGITRRLERSERIVEVVSLGNLQVFQERDGRFGTYGVLRHASSQPALPEPQQLAILKNALPLMDLLTSEDRQTFGIMVRIEEQWRFDPPAIEEILGEIGQIVKENVPPGSEYRIIGAPVIRKAIHHYNIQTAIRFGTLCLLICTAVSFYIFKSLRAMLVTLTVVGLCDLWILGIMSILGIRITSTTALAFGLVLISSVEPVIHLVTHFNEALRSVADRAAAAR